MAYSPLRRPVRPIQTDLLQPLPQNYRSSPGFCGIHGPPSPNTLTHALSAPTFLPAIATQRSTTSLQSQESIYSRKWTTEQKRLLHQRRERQWLRAKAKHACLDFSDDERRELRRYFDSLAESNQRMRHDKLENMLISLGLAESRMEVEGIVLNIDGDGTGELDFEEYLEIVRKRTDSKIFQVFKKMMEGKLGDRNLNFQTVISAYRRKLILDATGATNQTPELREHGGRILHNFAEMQRTRFAESSACSLQTTSPRSVEADDSVGPVSDLTSAGLCEFVHSGHAPVGGLGTVWRGVCHEHNLVSSRPNSADGKSKRTLERPPSPMSVVNAIVKVRPRRRFGGAHGTVVVEAPLMEDSAPRRTSKTPPTPD